MIDQVGNPIDPVWKIITNTHTFKVLDRMFLVEDHCQLEASKTNKIIESASL